MFKLQRLEITGFKSFADYTELVFTGNGITGIVGPNGCGKSNVADAIAWVLGEQKVKNLRGGEMKDVIFQGSKNRLPSGMAEVVLHMVRDETVEEEPDIEDIDATLEELDDQAEAVEERLAPELVVEAATTQTDAGAEVPAPSELNGMADASAANDSVNAAFDGIDVAAPAEASLSDGANVQTSTTEGEASAPVEDGGATVEDGAAVAASKSRGQHQHKRHWRPRRLALDFAPGETVSVTRRLYRDGDSEYLLNGRVCRLRDIQDLFSGTGLSGAHYAIIEQGRIGQILSAKPMDRRTLIEEAAGITKFRVRQRAAEARLEAARSNLNRVADIVSEIERQVGSLRRQAAKARRYRQIREELRELLRRVYAADERALNARLEDLRAKLEEAHEEVASLAGELEEREDGARRATAEAREREEELSEARAAVSESALRLDRRERERAYQGEQIAALEKRLQEVRREAEEVRARLSAVTSESESLVLKDVQMRESSEQSARQLAEAEESYARRTAEVLEAESAIERARGELLTHTAVAERLSETGRQLEAAVEKLLAQAEGLAREGERAAAAHEQAKAESAKLQAEIKGARTHLDALYAEREARTRELSEARAEVAAASAEHARVRDESARVRHRLDTLAELDAQHSLYSRAVQRLFTPAEGDPPRDFHVVATLADVLRVEPRWERAVESVLGPYLQSVIVPTPDDAMRGAAWLRAAGAGRATFLVAGLRGGAELDETFAETDGRDAAEDFDADAAGGDVRVADLLGTPREIGEVLRRTLAREISARVAVDLEQAMILTLPTGETCVTAEGEFVVGGQLIAAGGPAVAEEGSGLLAFKREMRELEVRMVGLSADLTFADEAARRARERLGELEDAFVLLNDEIGREEREHVAREVSAQQLQHEIERAERHMRVVADDAARLAAEQSGVEGHRAKQRADLEAAEEARAAAQASVSQAAEALASARRAAESENENLGRQRAQAAAAAERRRSAAAELRRMEAEAAELQSRHERHEGEASEMAGRVEELRRSLAELDESAAGVEDERTALERRVEQASARLAEARAHADSLSLQLTEMRQRADEARDMRAALEVQRAETAARLNYLCESCVNELNQSLDEISEAFQPEEGFDLEASRAHLEELRARVESFGAVNMMALEELAESEERLTFLTEQRKDITDGIASTEEALREIKRRSRERFRHAFEEVNRNFGQFFVELFGGGRGEMSLIDAEDVLESGIDIVAQPPGKRLQNVLLLSGGEKAMAALALVLAIFRYRPSPFCLLDEVDAPLDEANVGRFASKVLDMSADTQFLVITHNKRTMESARALYGVTMEEAGISRLVSVRFD
ncbi:MAG TPA: chromosome segregation protein SMC [Pyrinomonadaceae bacterium]|jgi:chromosome segregation protein|nr:chromosome segregation protein SMC [Pyrinomonadaceae bacterium]